MLGTLDDDQALSLIEALVAADGERVMAGVNEAAARGVEWEALLVEMQSLLHRIAMVQLSPSALGADMAAVELRMRELARTVPPTDVQLYYQTLLIGRKELPYAPDRRMGVEMTLLRALAFHPQCRCRNRRCSRNRQRRRRRRRYPPAGAAAAEFAADHQPGAGGTQPAAA
jgi:DNA polymerase-3 subunit gamma/tau